jgi:hypothetical protein
MATDDRGEAPIRTRDQVEEEFGLDDLKLHQQRRLSIRDHVDAGKRGGPLELAKSGVTERPRAASPSGSAVFEVAIAILFKTLSPYSAGLS